MWCLCACVCVLDLPIWCPNSVRQRAAASAEWCGQSQTRGKLFYFNNSPLNHRLSVIAVHRAMTKTVLRQVELTFHCFVSSLLPASPLTRGVSPSLWNVHVCLRSPRSVEEERTEETGPTLLKPPEPTQCRFNSVPQKNKRNKEARWPQSDRHRGRWTFLLWWDRSRTAGPLG